jgi:hypothetical protein
MTLELFCRVGADFDFHTFHDLEVSVWNLKRTSDFVLSTTSSVWERETSYHFDIKETRKKGHDFKDYICPGSLEFESNYFKIGNRYGRVIFLREYASYIKDSMVAELTDMNRNLMDVH